MFCYFRTIKCLFKWIFNERIVHFSSCDTLKLNAPDLRKFKTQIGADILSGYSKSVDGALSAINDIAYFDQLLNQDFSKVKTIRRMEKYYGDLMKELGFVIV